MSDPHEPTPEFVARIEEELRGGLRRASAFGARAVRRRGRLPLAAFALALAVVLGASGALFAQRAARQRERELVLLKAELRLEAAERRGEAAREALSEMRARHTSGVSPTSDLRAAEARASRAQAEIDLLRVDAAEARLTGRPPRRDLAAPLVAGDDLVMERQDIEQAALEAAREALILLRDEAKARYENGLIDVRGPADAERELAIGSRRLDTVKTLRALRRRFLAAELDTVKAALLGLRAKAEEARDLALIKREAADTHRARVRTLFEAGIATRAQLREAEERYARHESDARLAGLELDIVEERLRSG